MLFNDKMCKQILTFSIQKKFNGLNLEQQFTVLSCTYKKQNFFTLDFKLHIYLTIRK